MGFFDISLLWSSRKIRGGIHPAPRKQATAERTIVTDFPLPPLLYLPLQQHVGQPAEPVVRVGQRVRKGQLLAASRGMVSSPIHAPTSGILIDIMDYPAPHPSALPTPTLVLEPDGRDEWAEEVREHDPFTMPPEEIATRVGAAGVVGMGGAAFPSQVKLNLGRKSRITTLILNGGECEPYLTCDDRLMRERTPQIVDGISIMLHALQCGKALVGIEDNKPEALAAMRAAAHSQRDRIEVVAVPSLYPMGWDKQLIGYLTGKEVPADGRAPDVGVLMHNVATAYAIGQAIRYGRPLISRIVTVSGGGVSHPRNIEALIGTPLRALLEYCGHDPVRASRYIMGGPMMGEALPHPDVPLIKGTCGILSLTSEEIAASDVKPCIRCSRCVSACPVGLLPLEMLARIRVGQLESALHYGLKDCISCGSCAYVCPSQIPLVHYFKYANGELLARQQAQHKAEQTKKLAEARQARLARQRQNAAAQATARQEQAARREEDAA